MKYVWVVTQSIEGNVDLISIHATKESATLAAQKTREAHGHDPDSMTSTQKESYKTWKNEKDSFYCKFHEDDVSYIYSADREELRR